MNILLQSVTTQFGLYFVLQSPTKQFYCKVQQVAITKWVRYYKVWQLLQSEAKQHFQIFLKQSVEIYYCKTF